MCTCACKMGVCAHVCMCMHDGCVCVCACMHIYSHSIYPFFFFKPVYVQYNNTNRFQFRITHMQTTSQPNISFITIIYVLSTSVSLLFCSFFLAIGSYQFSYVTLATRLFHLSATLAKLFFYTQQTCFPCVLHAV